MCWCTARGREAEGLTSYSTDFVPKQAEAHETMAVPIISLCGTQSVALFLTSIAVCASPREEHH